MVGMPTVVEKGPIFLRYDEYFADPARRFKMLQVLRNTLAAGGDPLQTAGSDPGLLTNEVTDGKTEIAHTYEDWFGLSGGSSWFVIIHLPEKEEIGSDGLPVKVVDTSPKATLKPLDAKQSHTAMRTMNEGMIEALEVSLGLTDGDNGDLELADENSAWPVLLTAPPRDLPIDIYWVCGKGDGFEMQVSWNERQVTMFIVTPPISLIVYPIAEYPDGNGGQTRRQTAKTDDAQGMIVVRGRMEPDETSDDGKAVSNGMPDILITKQLMPLRSGGVSENPF